MRLDKRKSNGVRIAQGSQSRAPYQNASATGRETKRANPPMKNPANSPKANRLMSQPLSSGRNGEKKRMPARVFQAQGILGILREHYILHVAVGIEDMHHASRRRTIVGRFTGFGIVHEQAHPAKRH